MLLSWTRQNKDSGKVFIYTPNGKKGKPYIVALHPSFANYTNAQPSRNKCVTKTLSTAM